MGELDRYLRERHPEVDWTHGTDRLSSEDYAEGSRRGSFDSRGDGTTNAEFDRACEREMKIDTLEAALEKQRDCNFKDELRSLPERLRSPFARVELTVVEAKGLATKDASMLGGGSSDPYVIIYTEGTRAQVTSCKESTLNPNWNEIKNLELAGADSVVHLVMFDRNRMVKDEFMGELVLPLAEMPLDRGESLDAWYKLEQPASRSGDTVSGELRLIIRVSDVRESASRVRREVLPLGGAPEESGGRAGAARRRGSACSTAPSLARPWWRRAAADAGDRGGGLISRDSNAPTRSRACTSTARRGGRDDRADAGAVWSEEAKEPITSADAVVHVILFDQTG